MNDGDRAISNPPTPQVRRWARWADGGRPWGSIDIWPSRYGFKKYRLVVFPPGISPADRRRLRWARAWPTWGAALWLVLAVSLSGDGQGWAALIYPTTAFLASGAIVFALAREAHANTRTLTAAVIAGYDDEAALARFGRLETLARTLLAADEMRGRGESSAVEHEAVWWMVYDALGLESLDV